MTTEIETLIARRKALTKELETVTRQIEDEISEVYKLVAREKVVMQRYMNGDVLVISFDRYWWVRDGDLLEMAEQWEIEQMKELTKKGFFQRVCAE